MPESEKYDGNICIWLLRYIKTEEWLKFLHL